MAPRSTARSSRAAHTGRTGPCVERIVAAGVTPCRGGRARSESARRGRRLRVAARARRRRRRRRRRDRRRRAQRAVFHVGRRGAGRSSRSKTAISADGFVGRARCDACTMTGAGRRSVLPSPAGGDRRHRGRQRHGAHRRSAADRARRLPVSPADARVVRLADARHAGGARLVDPGRWASHNDGVGASRWPRGRSDAEALRQRGATLCAV